MATENTQNYPQDKHMEDHNYDGIHELDNPPPRWIMALFYLTIGFSIIYGAYYFWLKQGDHQDAESSRKSERHDQKYKIANMSTEDMVLLTDAASLDEGKQITKT